MQVSSKLGKGSEFSFSMDFEVPRTANGEVIDKNALMSEADTLANLKMLIAEDNPVNVLLMKKLLAKWNIKPVIANNGQHAIEVTLQGDFDIILMDLQMPVMNGFDAAKEIRKLPDPKKSSTPIIALTAAALFDIKEQVLNAGMNDYVSKPFKPEETAGEDTEFSSGGSLIIDRAVSFEATRIQHCQFILQSEGSTYGAVMLFM